MLSMPNNLFHHEMALPAARAEERDKEEKTAKNPFIATGRSRLNRSKIII